MTHEAESNLAVATEMAVGAGGAEIDLTSIKLSQDFIAMAAVKKLITSVPVRKPHRQEFIRVKPGEENRLLTYVMEDKDFRDSYLVQPQLWQTLLDRLPGDMVAKVLFVTLNRQNILSVWPIRPPGPDGRIDEWNRTAMEGALMAQERWIKVSSNIALGAYELTPAPGNIADPQWPDITFKEIVNIAFKGKVIDTMEHPVIRRLLGEV